MVTKKLLLLTAAIFILSPTLFAQTYTFSTPSGSTDSAGDPVSATATFVVSAGQVVVTLTDNLVNPKDIGQLISDLQFTLSGGGFTGTSTLSSSSGTTIFVNADGTTTAGSTGKTGWALGTTSSGLILCVICPSNITPTGPVPSQLIIGPPLNGVYSAANSSIAGNSPHNPFLTNSPTFTVSNSSINSTGSTLVSNVVFSFGTTFGNNVPTPEPGTLALFGTGLLAMARFTKRRIWS